MDAQEFTDVIQVCTDGSSLSEKGVTTAVELAKTLGLPLLGMTVVKGDAPENGLEGEPQEVRDRLQTIAEEAQAAGVPYLILAEHAATPHEGILSVAMRYDARFIVMASGLSRQSLSGVRNAKDPCRGRSSRVGDPLIFFGTQRFQHCLGRNAGDANTLIPTDFARDQRHAGFSCADFLSEERAQFGVSFAIDGRRRKRHFQLVVEDTRNGVLFGAGTRVNVHDNASICLS